MSMIVKTIHGIKELLSIYKGEIYGKENINIEQRNKIRKEFLNNLYKFRDEFPHLLYPLYGNSLSSDEINTIIENIKKHIQNLYYPQFPWDNFIDVIDGDIIETPQIVDFNSYQNSDIIIYDKYLDQFIISLLMSLPIGKIEFYIVDLESDFNNALLCTKLNPKVYNNKIIKTESELKSLLDKLNKIKNSRQSKYGKYIDYCNENKSIPEPYVFVLLTDEFKDKKLDSYYGDYFEGVYKSFQKELVELFKTTAKDGIYFVKRYNDNAMPQFEHFSSPFDYIGESYIYRYFCLPAELDSRDFETRVADYEKRGKDLSIRTFLYPKVMYATKYAIMYHEHGPNAIILDRGIPSYNTNYLNVVKKYCAEFILNEILIRRITIPHAIKTVDTLEEAKKILRDLESVGAKVSIKVTKNAADNTTPIVKCVNVIENPQYLQACVGYINYEADLQERKILEAIEAETKAKAEEIK